MKWRTSTQLLWWTSTLLLLCIAPNPVAAQRRKYSDSPADVTPSGSPIWRAKGNGGAWHDHRTWSSPYSQGTFRTPQDHGSIEISEGATVTIEQPLSMTLDMLFINGTLQLSDASAPDVSLTITSILVRGANAALRAGTPASPYAGKVELTFNGTTAWPDSSGGRSLVVRDGGVLSLHGQRKTSWTRLDATAMRGNNEVIVQGPLENWQVGGQWACASTASACRLLKVTGVCMWLWLQ